MIKQAIDRIRIQPRRSRPGILAIGLILGLGSVPGTGIEARADRLDSVPTNAPLKYPTFLDDEGRILSDSSTTHSLAARDKTKAAYVAFKLRNGAAVSRSVPLVTTRATGGTETRRAIAAMSANTGRIAVRTQRGLFLVNKLRSNSVGANRRISTAPIATRAQQLEGTGSSSAPRTSAGGLNLHNLLDPNTPRNSPDSSPLGPQLPLDSPRPTESTTNPDGPPAAVADPDTPPSTSPSAIQIPISLEIRPAPVPEPGTLAFAGLAIGGAVLREGLRRRAARRRQPAD